MAVAALVAWLVTAAIGFYMLGTWLANGGARSYGAGSDTRFPPPVAFGHFLVAAAGLVLWIIYVFTDTEALAWIAFVVLLVVAGLGDVLVLRWVRGRRHAGTAPASGSANQPGSAGSVTTSPVTSPSAEQRIPSVAVIAHGVVAVTTIVLVLLAALEVGG